MLIYNSFKVTRVEIFVNGGKFTAWSEDHRAKCFCGVYVINLKQLKKLTS